MAAMSSGRLYQGRLLGGRISVSGSTGGTGGAAETGVPKSFINNQSNSGPATRAQPAPSAGSARRYRGFSLNGAKEL